MPPAPIGPDYCPACGSDAVVPGTLGTAFVPHRCAPEPQARVRLPATAHACARCGLVWSVVRPDALLARLVQTGDPLVKQQLDRFDRGALHDLPDDSFEAKVAAECVAEIDRLVWSGAAGEAARRYRTYTGRPSPEAAETIRAWASLPRAGKLERLGWTSGEA